MVPTVGLSSLSSAIQSIQTIQWDYPVGLSSMVPTVGLSSRTVTKLWNPPESENSKRRTAEEL